MSAIEQESSVSTAAIRAPARKASRRRIEPFAAASYVTVTLFGLFCLVPLWVIVAGSLTDESVLGLNGYSLFPQPFSLRAYELLFTGQSLLNGYVASLFITVVGTILSISCTASIAWVSGLSLHRLSQPEAPASFVYEPAFAFIVRGAKRVVVGNQEYVYDEGHFLLTSIGLPTVVQVLGPSGDSPYLSIKLDLDLDLARDLITEVDQIAGAGRPDGPGIAIGPVTPALANACLRLLELLESGQDAAILASAIQREILYRVLTSAVGSRLRETVEQGTRANRVFAAIHWIRRHFAEPMQLEALAGEAGMGVSTLHHHFRALTAMSPLQYQKLLRLHEARRLMLSDRLDASSAAYRVGYESTTQFNREYRRLFGSPPKRDVSALLNTFGR